jgi:hypothetical protein
VNHSFRRRYSLSSFCVPVVAAVGITVSAANAAYQPVYGNPARDPATNQQYQVQNLPPPAGLRVNSHGVALVQLNRNVGSSVVRMMLISPTGARELAPLHFTATSPSYVRAYDLNDAGQVVGDVNGLPVFWAADGTSTELAFPDGMSGGTGRTISSDGVIGGVSSVLGARTALRWTSTGSQQTDISGGIEFTDVRASSDTGYMIGWQGSNPASRTPLRWAPGATSPEVLYGYPLGFNISADNFAIDVNDAGTTVGFATYEPKPSGYEVWRATRWEADTSTPTRLTTSLDDTPDRTVSSSASSLNVTGDAVGDVTVVGPSTSEATPVISTAVRWNAGSTAGVLLPKLGPANAAQESKAYDISDGGIVVGYSDLYDGLGALIGQRAVYWTPDGQVVDLNALIDPAAGWTLTQAYAISDENDWIVGIGRFDHDGNASTSPRNTWFVMQIPEPGMTGILGFAAIALVRRRRA